MHRTLAEMVRTEFEKLNVASPELLKKLVGIVMQCQDIAFRDLMDKGIALPSDETANEAPGSLSTMSSHPSPMSAISGEPSPSSAISSAYYTPVQEGLSPQDMSRPRSYSGSNVPMSSMMNDDRPRSLSDTADRNGERSLGLAAGSYNPNLLHPPPNVVPGRLYTPQQRTLPPVQTSVPKLVLPNHVLGTEEYRHAPYQLPPILPPPRNGVGDAAAPTDSSAHGSHGEGQWQWTGASAQGQIEPYQYLGFPLHQEPESTLGRKEINAPTETRYSSGREHAQREQ
jgi:hypothetical protein